MGVLITRYTSLRLNGSDDMQQRKCEKELSATYQQLRRMALDQIIGKKIDQDEADGRMLGVQEVKARTLDELEMLKDEI
eukprot:9080456-Pyramimonas_sp.AAC.1